MPNKSENRLRVGIAGYGVVGKRRHAFIDQHPRLRVVAVCDQQFSNRGEFESGVRFYPNYTQMLEESLDVLFVCLPNYIAPEVTIAGLERGLHVFGEKPPAKDLAGMQAIIDCERRHPELKLKFGFNHRYHDSVRDALRIIESGELGEIVNMRGVYGKSAIISFESDWRTRRGEAGGGILLDQGIHMVDLMRLFAGEFADVKSFVSNDFWKHDVEDNAYALLRTQGGMVAMLHSTATQWRHTFNLEITLSRGALLLSGILSGSKSYGQERLAVCYRGVSDSGNPRETTTSYIEDNSWRDEIFEFADAVVNQAPVVHGTSSDALRTMELVYRIYSADDDWRRKFELLDKS
ncbi:MAG TPA: Gfo/Idh/MocA family oxidoreductase [Burkholderiales bacterium]|nr:Gfo/Idh/MocA family oxidoreductase [Burkholderiales bacterium]